MIIGIIIMTGITSVKNSKGGFTGQKPQSIGSSGESTTTHQVNPVPTESPLTPNQVAAAFYLWYLTYKGNPLSTGAYEKSNYLTEDFKHEINLLYNEDPNTDPVICPQNKTLDAIVEAPTYDATGQNAQVLIVSRVNGRYLHQVNLVHFGSGWLINDIICEP